MGATGADLIWAASLAHSRSFAVCLEQDVITHIIAPGIDLANHSADPTAFVRQALNSLIGLPISMQTSC